MADLKHLGVVLTLVTCALGLVERALGAYAAGRNCLPGSADRFVQLAEDIGVAVYKTFLDGAVRWAGRTAAGLLHWADDQLDQRYAVVVKYYESSKTFVTECNAHMQDTHSMCLRSFSQSRKAVATEFETIVESLQERGAWGALVTLYGIVKKYTLIFKAYAASSAESGVRKFAERTKTFTIVDFAMKLWTFATGASCTAKAKGMASSILKACMNYMRNFTRAPRATASSVAEIPWRFAIERADAILSYVVGSQYYSRALDTARGYTLLVLNSTIGRKVVAIVDPYLDPYIQMAAENSYVHGIMKRLKLVNSD